MEEKKNSKKGVKKGNTTTKKSTTSTKKSNVKKASTTKKSNTKATAKNNATKKVVETKKTVTTKKPIESKKVVKTKPVEIKPARKDNFFKKVGHKFCTEFKRLNDKCENDKPFFIMLLISALLFILLVCVVYFGRIPTTKNGEKVLANLDGKEITVDNLYKELKDQYGLNSLINSIDKFIADKEVKSKDDKKELEEYAKQAVDYYKEYAEYYGVDFETFLASYVGISGVTDEDSFYNYVYNDYKKTLAVKNYLASTYTDKEVKEYYNENYAKVITVRDILIEVEDDKDTEAKEKAEKLIKELNKVKNNSDKLTKKFKDLAYDNSDDSTYSEGGLKSKISKSEVSEEFWNAANKLKNGKYTTEAIKDEYGYHIILKVSSSKGKDLKEVENEIRTKLAEEALQNDSNLQVTTWDKLRKKYNLKIYDKNIEKAYKDTIKNYSNNSSNVETDSEDTTTEGE